MYDHITGDIIKFTPNLVVLNAGGVGYAMKVSLNTYTQIKASCPNGWEFAKELLYVHLSVTETAMTMYGFKREQERQCFLLLIAVSGIGPISALNILSYMTTEEVSHAAVQEDKAAFKKVKGIGDKGAAQIVLDLKGKFKVDESMPTLTSLPPAAQPFVEEAVSALTGLGFNKTDARKLVDSAIASEATELEDIIKSALKSSK